MNDISDFEHEQLNKYSAYIVLLFFYCVFAFNGVNYLFLSVSDDLSALMSVLVLGGFWICFMRVYPKFLKYYRLAEADHMPKGYISSQAPLFLRNKRNDTKS